MIKEEEKQRAIVTRSVIQPFRWLLQQLQQANELLNQPANGRANHVHQASLKSCICGILFCCVTFLVLRNSDVREACIDLLQGLLASMNALIPRRSLVDVNLLFRIALGIDTAWFCVGICLMDQRGLETIRRFLKGELVYTLHSDTAIHIFESALPKLRGLTADKALHYLVVALRQQGANVGSVLAPVLQMYNQDTGQRASGLGNTTETKDEKRKSKGNEK